MPTVVFIDFGALLKSRKRSRRSSLRIDRSRWENKSPACLRFIGGVLRELCNYFPVLHAPEIANLIHSKILIPSASVNTDGKLDSNTCENKLSRNEFEVIRNGIKARVGTSLSRRFEFGFLDLFLCCLLSGRLHSFPQTVSASRGTKYIQFDLRNVSILFLCLFLFEPAALLALALY